MSRRSVQLAVVAFGVMVALSGCAAARASIARKQSLQGSLTNHVLAVPPEQTLQTARLVLVEQGFAPKDNGDGVLETSYKYSSSSSGTGSSSKAWRYVVTAVPMGAGTKLVAMKNSQSSSSGTGTMGGYSTNSDSTRDFEMELEILRRLEPEKATQYSDEADARAEEARQQ